MARRIARNLYEVPVKDVKVLDISQFDEKTARDMAQFMRQLLDSNEYPDLRPKLERNLQQLEDRLAALKLN